MTLLDRYLKGDTEEVYNDIYSLGQAAFHLNYFSQIDLILKETFKRVAFNLSIVYNELKDFNYQFLSNSKHDWQRPLVPPDPSTNQLIIQLKSRTHPCGHIPLSLEYFYRIVGSCNFCWDWKTTPDIPWEGADPIDIPPLKDILEMVYNDYDNKSILISGDYLQKDNVSGDCYTIELTSKASVDGLFSGWDIPFIEYLRLTFENCGFSRAGECNYDSLNSFCHSTRPLLQKI